MRAQKLAMLRIASESFPFDKREQVAKRKRDFYLYIYLNSIFILLLLWCWMGRGSRSIYLFRICNCVIFCKAFSQMVKQAVILKFHCDSFLSTLKQKIQRHNRLNKYSTGFKANVATSQVPPFN